VHQICFRPGLRPYPAGGAYSAPPDLHNWFKGGPTSKGRGEEGKERDRREEGEGSGGGKESRNVPPSIPAYAPGS